MFPAVSSVFPQIKEITQQLGVLCLVSTVIEQRLVGIRGYDANPRVLEFTTQNIENAGLDEHIRLAHKPIDQFGKPTAEHGLLLTNPPYGERLGEPAINPLLV